VKSNQRKEEKDLPAAWVGCCWLVAAAAAVVACILLLLLLPPCLLLLLLPSTVATEEEEEEEICRYKEAGVCGCQCCRKQRRAVLEENKSYREVL
jgi:hypothetical protein